MPKPHHPGDCPDEVSDQNEAAAATRRQILDLERLRLDPVAFAKECFPDELHRTPWQHDRLMAMMGADPAAAHVWGSLQSILPTRAVRTAPPRPPRRTLDVTDPETGEELSFYWVEEGGVAGWLCTDPNWRPPTAAKRRRRVRFEVRDAILSRRLGLRPSVWRG